MVKEFAVLKFTEQELIHHIFLPPLAWNLLTASEKSQSCWLTANHHGLQWNDGYIDFALAKTAIRSALSSEIKTQIYVKGAEKQRWLVEIVGDIPNVSFVNIDADYDDIGPIRYMNAARTFRCGRHKNICAMENVLKLYNWWCERRDKLRDVQHRIECSSAMHTGEDETDL